MSHENKVAAFIEAVDASQDIGPGDILLKVNLRLKLDEVAEIEARALLAQDPRRPTAKELRRLACRIYEARRTREKILDAELFGEPAWDMLLALFHMPAQGRFLSVSALCHAGAVPPTTGLRWQKLLGDEGLIERGPDEVDARRQIVRLTEKGRSLMEMYLARLFYCGTSMPSQPEPIGG